MDNPIQSRRSDLEFIKKQNQKKKKKIKKLRKRTCHLVDFSVPANHRVKTKESKNIYKYMDLARELKKLLNMKVPVIPIVLGALGTAPKNFERILEELEIRRRIETIQTKALLKSAKIRVWGTWRDMLLLRLQ